MSDNTLQLVTADGNTLQVNQSSYPRLFKALKGGSNNFGIVTRFDLKAFKLGKLWAGEIVYAASSASQQYQALYNFVDSSPAYNATAGDAQIILAYTTLSETTSLFANFYSYTLPTAWPPRFSDFKAIGPTLDSSMRTSNLSDFAIELGTGTPNNFRYLFGTLTVKNDLEWFHDLKNISDALFAPLFKDSAVPGLVLSVVLQPLTASMLTAGCDKNSLGLCPSDGNLVLLDLTVQWSYANNDTLVNTASQRLIEEASSSALARGILHQYIYLNYALENQDPIASYGEQNLVELRSVSKKFDPGQVFQRLVPGGFKLYR